MLKANTKKQLKEGISVYNPSNPLEKAIQDAYHFHNDDWLPSFACQTLAKSLASLKPQWLDNEGLFFQRASYFFSPSMSRKKDKVVFVTYPLFLRDIMENGEINNYLHAPITFVSLPIAHFLLREYPIQLVFDWSKLQAENPGVEFLDIGGLIVAPSDNVKMGDALYSSMERDDSLVKAAATEIRRDVYKIDEHKRNLLPQTEIWDKLQRRKAVIETVGMGEAGDVTIRYESGDEIVLPKLNFDERFTVTKVASVPGYRLQINGSDVVLTEPQIIHLIKEKIKGSKIVQKTCKEFDVDPQRIDDLRVIITDLDSIYAETDKETMKLNRSIFERDFFESNFFIIVHEIVHWLSRIKESRSYYNDPEEVLGFCMSIAYELETGHNYQQIYEKIFPKMEWHFHDKETAKLFFDKSLEKAKKMLL